METVQISLRRNNSVMMAGSAGCRAGASVLGPRMDIFVSVFGQPIDVSGGRRRDFSPTSVTDDTLQLRRC
jgi:hypothetical protein